MRKFEVRPERPSVAFFGAPHDTGNLGVAALGIATMAELDKPADGCEWTVFDFHPGRAERFLALPGGAVVPYERRGAYRSRRFHRMENLQTMDVVSRVAPKLHPTIRLLDRAAVILDSSGGDSFTDLYGDRRFVLITKPKLISLRRHRPLVLLPQTYGPFRQAEHRRIAQRIVAGSRLAFARDEDGFDALRELAGADLDPQRHRLGVDVAFGLPAAPLPDGPAAQIRALREKGPLAGVNVSGLLSNDAETARRRFGLQADVPAALARFVRRLLQRTEASVLFVPHVGGARHEDDHLACQRLMDDLPQRYRDRVVALPPGLDAMQTKSAVGAVDWFTGARMHATIAALSQGIAVYGLAYSDKMAGVFRTCGVGEEVVDARRIETSQLVESLSASWERREHVGARVREHLPAVRATLRGQFDSIAATIEGASTRPPGPDASLPVAAEDVGRGTDRSRDDGGRGD